MESFSNKVERTFNVSLNSWISKPKGLEGGEKGICTSEVNSKSELEDKERKHKKRKDRDRDYKKHKNRHKDKVGATDRNRNAANGLKTEQLKEQQEMSIRKSRFDDFEDLSVGGHKKAR